MKPLTIAFTLWGIFWAYWFLSGIYTRSKNKVEINQDSKRFQLMHYCLMVVGLALLGIPFETPILGTQWIPSSGWITITGLLVQLVSMGFAVWARFILGRNWSSAIQKVEGQQVIKSGPYRYIRNPIYSGMLLGFISTAFINGSIAGLIGLALILTSFLIKIHKEQAFLVREFGDEYREYMRHSWALIPFIY